jgi:chorismate mutase
MGGKRSLILTIAQQAMDMNYDGLIIESHCSPETALSDKEQQLTPAALNEVIHSLVIRDSIQSTEDLSTLRGQIDELDDKIFELLSKRMRVSREIGQYKLEHDMARYCKIVFNRRLKWICRLNLLKKFWRLCMKNRFANNWW